MELNASWLAIFQKHRVNLTDILDLSQGICRSYNLVSQESQENIYKMAENLVSACDGIKKHGLIDYEYGVEEGRIIEGSRGRSSTTILC